MKELLLALLEAANKLYPMRGVHTGWCTAGSFTHQKHIYSFILENQRGTFRQVDIHGIENEWFDVIKCGGQYISIIHNGIKYNAQPKLQL